MTEDMANAFDEYSPIWVEIRDDYSGRLGATTFAVCFESDGDFKQALATVALEIGSNIGEIEGHGCIPDREYLPRMKSLAKELREGFTTDTRGLRVAVY